MPAGTVKWFNRRKGYGFIEPENGDKDIFIHITAVKEAGLETLREEQHVSFDLTERQGRQVAVNLSSEEGEERSEAEESEEAVAS